LSIAEINTIFGDFKMEGTTIGQDLIAMGQIKGETLGRTNAVREDVIDLLTSKWNSPNRTVLY
jgi:hypothetical protein